MLELKKITKIYQTEDLKQKALDNININFRKSEFASILGPSGSGKTTLLNIIGGLDKYTSGDLIINETSTKKYTDRNWDSYRNHRVGFVFQSYNLISHQTILANIELALTLSGVNKTERRKRAIKALKSVGLEEHKNKKPNQLSGGQMQRVAIARALVNNPDILLADEPTGALDSETSEQIMKLLAEVAHDRLVIMVTHNPDLALEYSNRIIKLKDGRIIDDSNPYDGTTNEKNDEDIEKNKTKKTSMSLLTALSLSLNNLITKKGRTILTAFAGSIGIIGIALILSLSNGIQQYIKKTEKETLSSYPLSIKKQSIDMSAMLSMFAGNHKSQDYNDNKIHSVNVMGDMFTSMSQKVQTNDLKAFNNYLKDTNIKDYTSDIKYGYDITMNLYKDDDSLLQVNPTKVFDSIGMGTSEISSAYDSYMSNYDIFGEMIDNKDLLHQQYDLVAGSWPQNYNEVVLQVDKDNQVIDYTLYSLGILSQTDLKKQFNNMSNGREVSFEQHSYDPSDLIGLTYKLVLNSDYYSKINGIWINEANNTEYMKNVVKNAESIKIVGIIKPNSEAVTGSSTGMVYYTHDLTEHLINKINESEIAKEQLSNKDINVFTSTKFSSTPVADINSLTKEQISHFENMSKEELAEYMKTYTENESATYESNLTRIGICSLDNPDSISIYPKDFDSKEEIVSIIDRYNEGKDDNNKITYSDIVGVMMSSVSSIVNVISSILIAFVAISLIVSSIMIAIITYISVIERTKEIGILRAIGASKKDISRVFNAETLIEGFASGVFGIIVTIILNIPINIIIKNTVKISGISSLPIDGALILVLISMLLTIIAGLIPARMASRRDPVESLRSE